MSFGIFSRFSFDDFSPVWDCDFYSSWTHSPRFSSVHCSTVFQGRRRPRAKPNRSFQESSETFPNRFVNSRRVKKSFTPQEQPPARKMANGEEFLEANNEKKTRPVLSMNDASNETSEESENHKLAGKSPQQARSYPVHGRDGKKRRKTKAQKEKAEVPNSFKPEQSRRVKSDENDISEEVQQPEDEVPCKNSSELQLPTNDENTGTSESTGEDSELVMESSDKCEHAEEAVIDEKVGLIEVQLARARELAPRVERFCGDVKERLYLEEHLTRCMLELDKVEANGSDKVKASRKAALREIDSLLSDLDT